MDARGHHRSQRGRWSTYWSMVFVPFGPGPSEGMVTPTNPDCTCLIEYILPDST
jgi:hypothetical protein